MSQFIVLENLTLRADSITSVMLQPTAVAEDGQLTPEGETADSWELALVIVVEGKRLTIRKQDALDVVHLYLTFLKQTGYPYAQEVCDKYMRELYSQQQQSGDSEQGSPASNDTSEVTE